MCHPHVNKRVFKRFITSFTSQLSKLCLYWKTPNIFINNNNTIIKKNQCVNNTSSSGVSIREFLSGRIDFRLFCLDWSNSFTSLTGFHSLDKNSMFALISKLSLSYFTAANLSSWLPVHTGSTGTRRKCVLKASRNMLYRWWRGTALIINRWTNWPYLKLHTRGTKTQRAGRSRCWPWVVPVLTLKAWHGRTDG